MRIEFRLPDVGEGIDAAELLDWLVNPGDTVREDDPLAEVETDKAVVTIPCPVTGTIVGLCAEVGERIPVGAVLAVFEAEQGTGAAGSESITTAPGVAQSLAPAAGPGDPSTPIRPLASPSVRKLARELGIDLTEVTGRGPGGRILREDVEAIAASSYEDSPPTVARDPELASSTERVVRLSGIRRTIARDLTEAWRTIPHIIDYREVDATALTRARQSLRDRAQRGGDSELSDALTLTPLLVKMVVHALAANPYANASLNVEREVITLHGDFHIGVATATAHGLMVPVVHHADRKSTSELALEIAALVKAARARKLSPHQLSGGTATVNNYGGLGVWLGTPIIKPPQVVNVGIGRVMDRAVVVNGEIQAQPTVVLAVSGDHRVLDGDALAMFVTDLVAVVEDPFLLLESARS